MIHILFVQIHSYQTEKRFIYEQERLMQLESLLQVSIIEFRKGNYEPIINHTIQFHYDTGKATFTIRTLSNGISQIHVNVTLQTGHERIAGFDFNWENSDVQNYWEGVKPTATLFNKSPKVKEV
jgi:hypothetical protein